MANEVTTISKQKGGFEITNAKVIGILAAVALYLGSYFIDRIVNDPHKRINHLVVELKDLKDAVRILQISTINIENNGKNCADKNIEQETKLNALENWRYLHIKETYTWKNETQRWRGKMEANVSECQRHLEDDKPYQPRGPYR